MVPYHFRPEVSFLAPKFDQIIETRIAALAASVRRERGSSMADSILEHSEAAAMD